MNTTLIEEVKNTVKNWWVSLVLGILFIIVAILLMFYPIEGYGTLIILFSVCMFVSGIFEIIFATSNRHTLSGWGWYLTCGIIDLLMGIFLIATPAITAVLIPFLLAFWIMFRGFSAIGFSIEFQRYGIKGWGWYLVFGILAILCAFLILWYPGAGALASVYILAFAFLFMGFFRIMLAFEMRDLHKNNNHLLNQLKHLE